MTAREHVKGVFRVERAAKRMFGYLAHVHVDGRLVKRFFSDLRHGGPDGAFQAAKQAVLDCRAEHDTYLSLKRRHHRRANSPGDVPGVNRVPARERDARDYWAARWIGDDGVRRYKRFSVKVYGEVGAYESALRCRLAASVGQRETLRLMTEKFEDFDFDNQRAAERVGSGSGEGTAVSTRSGAR